MRSKSSITTRERTVIRRDALDSTDLSDVTTGELLPNVTPGEILKVEFMEPLRLSARALARDMRVPANRVTEILNGERTITAETAILLSRRLGTSAEFWMNLQTAHDLEEARRGMAVAV
jgi:antitoxin HigA-1